MNITSIKKLKITEQSQEVRPEVARFMKEISKKYAEVWKDLAKV